MDDSYFQHVKQFLASNKAEAREWLRAGSATSVRNLGEMDAEESKEFVDRLYGLGAEQVLAVEIDEYPEGANTQHVLVRLPAEDSARAQVFAYECKHAESCGFDATPDEGQEYLYFNAK